ncbi:MAG TPA: amidohydrolase [Bryobacteraceae bacterium]|nr:amidohydrolase [Bryobacteraceae bacterium]
MKSKPAALVTLAMLLASTAASQAPDTILINGKIVTVDPQAPVRQALAIRDGHITALGSTAEIRKLAGAKSKVIDLQGRTAIPGLIDSHMHAIRAALSFSTEVNWIGASSITEAVARVHEASQSMKAGAWLIVAGGWNVLQFKERRRPDQAELLAAAPNNPVYIQLGYGWVMMTPAGFKALNIADDSDLPQGAKLDRDATGNLTGGITGGNNAIVALFDKLPKPNFEQQVAGTKKFFRELNRLGITGVVDPGGNNLDPPDYQAILKVWRDGQMTVRVAYALCGDPPGAEFAHLKELTQLLPMGFGDDMLRFNGIGERITWAMNNNNRPSDADKQKYYEIVRWAAERGMAVTMHWTNEESVDQLLTIFERVNREVPITGLRWSIAHLNNASPETLRRMKTLGMGWTVQDSLYFGGEQLQNTPGVRREPPVMTAKEIGVAVGAGTDAHRVASYNPFTALQWFLDGKTVSGIALRGPEETPSRAEALRLYTLGSAWFSRDEDKRGSLAVGKLADLAVLTKDYMTAPVEQVGGIDSVLTMVGGKIVYASGPYKKLEDLTPR